MSQQKKLIILQENENGENIFAFTKTLMETYKVSESIIVLNKNFDEIEEEFMENETENFNMNNVTIMQDYFYKKYGNLSSMYTALEDIEDGILLVCKPSECFDKDNLTIHADKIEIINSDMISEYEKNLEKEIDVIDAMMQS